MQDAWTNELRALHDHLLRAVATVKNLLESAAGAVPSGSMWRDTIERQSRRVWVEQFLCECVRKDPCAKTGATTLYMIFSTWSRLRGTEEIGRRTFGMTMHNLGYRTLKANVHFWLGLEPIVTVERLVATQARQSDSPPTELRRAGADNNSPPTDAPSAEL